MMWRERLPRVEAFRLVKAADSARSLCLWRGVALVAGATYLVWNLVWLVRGQIPAALFQAITRLPAPTTGGTRAMLALAAGDWQGSLALNPLAVPLTAMFGLTLAWPVWTWWRVGRLRLPYTFVWIWLVMLGLAWLAKGVVLIGGWGR